MKSIFSLLAFALSFAVQAQPGPLIVRPGIFLPTDSLERAWLTNALNSFLILARGVNEANDRVDTSQRIETWILLDEIRGIEKKASTKDDFFYKPYLSNVVPLNPDRYLLQISWLGSGENGPELRAVFELIAARAAGSFLFSSPLRRNTVDWKTEKFANNIFHYRSTLDRKTVKDFCRLAATFDAKLGTTGKTVDFYCCEDLPELQKLTGVLYKSDYNGRDRGIWSSSFGYNKIVVLGDHTGTFGNFDRHDLWHDRLSLAVNRSKIYRPVDEACAYLYGGSWGLTWGQILDSFKLKVVNRPGIDWTEVKETPLNFGETRRTLMADYVIDALIIQKLEREKGFGAVWQMLNCGMAEKGNAPFYKTLERLTGVTKDRYNDWVWNLIRAEK